MREINHCGRKVALTDGYVLYILDPEDAVRGFPKFHQREIYRSFIIFTVENNQLKIIKNHRDDFSKALDLISRFLNKHKEEEKKGRETFVVTCHFDGEQQHKYCDNLEEAKEYILELAHGGEVLSNITLFKGDFCEFEFKVEVNDG